MGDLADEVPQRAYINAQIIQRAMRVAGILGCATGFIEAMMADPGFAAVLGVVPDPETGGLRMPASSIIYRSLANYEDFRSHLKELAALARIFWRKHPGAGCDRTDADVDAYLIELVIDRLTEREVSRAEAADLFWARCRPVATVAEVIARL